MKIIKIIVKEAIQSLGSNISFDVKKYPEMKLSVELQVVSIENTLIPLSNIREIVLEKVEEVKEHEVFEPKVKPKKGV